MLKKCTPLWREAHFEVKRYKTHHSRTTFGGWDVEKVHAIVARSTFPSQNVQKHTIVGPLLEVEMSKKCTPLWREAHFQVKMYKAHQVRTTFGSWDVEKVHAVVARSTFPSQNVQNTPFSDHFWKLRCRKSARRCGAKHISKSKCTKHTRSGPLLAVKMLKKCTPLWREAHFQVKMYKTHHSRTTFGSWDVEKVHAVVARSTFRSQNVQNTRGSDHFWKLRCRKSARRCGAKHISKSKCTKHHMFAPLLEVRMSKKCTPLWREAHFPSQNVASLHYTTLHYTTLHSTTLRSTTLHYITQHYNYNYTTTLHYTKLHYATLHYTTLHYTTLHYTALPSTTLRYITLHSTTLQLQLHNYTPLQYTPLHSTTLQLQLHYITLHYTPLHYTTLHYTTFHYTSLHYNYTTLHPTTLQLQLQLRLHNYTPLHSTTRNYTTLHYTTLRYIPLHSTTLHYITLNDTAPQIDR